MGKILDPFYNESYKSLLLITHFFWEVALYLNSGVWVRHYFAKDVLRFRKKQQHV